MSEVKTTRIQGSAIGLGGVLGILGLVLCGAGFASNGADLNAWSGPFLYGAMFWGCLTFGCLALTLLFHLTRGRWGTPVLRIFEAGSGISHLAFIGFLLVVVCGVVFKDALYAGWLSAPADDLIVAKKSDYLNWPFFMVRGVLYFALMIGMSHLLKTWTRQEEATGDKKFSDKRNNFAGAATVVFGLVMTFLTTDFVMSIDPHWFSTIWGIWFIIGGALAAMSLAVMMIVTQKDKEPYKDAVDDLMIRDFGNMLLMLTMVWGYFSFSQFLIIWSGNLKEFVTFYLARLRGNYSGLGSALMHGQFTLPFMFLIFSAIKRNLGFLGFVAGWIFLFRFVDLYWIIMPYFRSSLTPQLGDFGPLCLIGGIWIVVFGLNLKSAPLMVAAHPYEKVKEGRLQEAIENV